MIAKNKQYYKKHKLYENSKIIVFIIIKKKIFKNKLLFVFFYKNNLYSIIKPNYSSIPSALPQYLDTTPELYIGPDLSFCWPLARAENKDLTFQNAKLKALSLP